MHPDPWNPSFSLNDTNLRLSQLKAIIYTLFILWFIVGILDVIISNQYCPPLIFVYIYFPNSSFPAILVPFILYILILSVCFAIYGWKSYCYFNIQHIKCALISILLSITICIIFSISPIFVHIFILYKVASLARDQMMREPFASPKFGYMRDINHYFNAKIVSNLKRKHGENKLSNPILLRYLLYTMTHFHAIRKYKKLCIKQQLNEKSHELKHKYLLILKDAMSIIRKKGLSMTRFNQKINELYWKKYCMTDFSYWWSKVERVSFSQTMSNFGKLFVVSLFIHTVIHWGGFSDLYLRKYEHDQYEQYKDKILLFWVIRDLVSILISITLIFFYRSEVKIFVRERFCWMNSGNILDGCFSIFGNKSYEKNQNEAYLAYETMYALLWSEMMREKLDVLIEHNYNMNIQWMVEIIIEFCYGISTNNHDIVDIAMWDDIMFNNDNFEYQMIVPHIASDHNHGDIDIIDETMDYMRSSNILKRRMYATIEDKGYFAKQITTLLNGI